MDNDVLLTEILLRLPAKSLTRFTSVSQKWRSLISSDDFRHRHTTLCRPSTTTSSLLVVERHLQDVFYMNSSIIKGEKAAVPLTLALPGDHREYWILNACNGLLLLRSFIKVQSSKDGRHLNLTYFVYNPTTRQSREITLPRTDIVAETLAFDPSKSPYYKIVCITCDLEDYSCQAVVYDSEFHEWEIKPKGFAYPDRGLPRWGKVWNGAVYWSSDTCYDLEKNEMRALDCPPIIHGHEEGDEFLEEIDGRVYRFVLSADHYHRRQKGGFEVGEWELGDRGEKWESKGLLHVGPHPREHSFRFTMVMRFMGDGGGDIYCLMLHSDGTMSAYSFVKHRYEDIEFPADHRRRHQHYQLNSGWLDSRAFQFRETLALV